MNTHESRWYMLIFHESVMEMQTILTEFIENFKVAFPDDGTEIRRASAGLMLPIVRGKENLGTQMPLHITPL